ncbi:MAG: TetR/AcrR family transcriptional regulator [Pseudorhodoplanes sp.]
MAQVKKPELRQAILKASFSLFSKSGYHNTTIAQIAKQARLSTANVYIYFPSKLHILYALYEPWLSARLDDMEAALEHLKSPRSRVRYILRTLWRDLPAQDNAFANNFIQAIATADPGMGYRPELLYATRQRVAGMLLDALSEDRNSRATATRIANVVMMAFDGYVIGRHLQRRGDCDDRTLNLFVDLLTGPTRANSKRKTSRKDK